MRLSDTQRAAICRAIRSELPALNRRRKIEDKLCTIFARKLPKTLRDLYADPSLRPHIRHYPIMLHGPGGLAIHTAVPTADIDPETQLTAAEQKRLTADLKKLAEEVAERDKAMNAIADVLKSCATVKQARERLPEDLHKYLPSPKPPAAPNLPAPGDLMSKLRKAGYGKRGAGNRRASA